MRIKCTCVPGSAAEPVAAGTLWMERGSAQPLPSSECAEVSCRAEQPRSFPR